MIRKMTPLLMTAALALAGCSSQDMLSDVSGEAISEQVQGLAFAGYDNGDEAPCFGECELFPQGDFMDYGVATPNRADGGDDEPHMRPEVAQAVLTLRWGHLRRYPERLRERPVPHDFIVTVSSELGTVKPRKLILFEKEDSLTVLDPQTVEASSTIYPHFDGMLLKSDVPTTGEGPEMITVTVQWKPMDGETYEEWSQTFPLALPDRPPVERMVILDSEDDLALHVAAMRIDPDCRKGLLHGRWVQFEADDERLGQGVMRANAVDLLGRTVGHIKGRWAKGKLAGKVIDRDGRFAALFLGRYKATPTEVLSEDGSTRPTGRFKALVFEARRSELVRGAMSGRYHATHNLDDRGPMVLDEVELSDQVGDESSVASADFGQVRDEMRWFGHMHGRWASFRCGAVEALPPETGSGTLGRPEAMDQSLADLSGLIDELRNDPTWAEVLSTAEGYDLTDPISEAEEELETSFDD